MVPEEDDIIGLEEDGNKMKGIAEFSFNDREKPEFSIDASEPKKKEEHKIIIRNARDRKRARAGKNSELF
jgi:hypothetical protein